jgi:NitT/TauT family transport system ATP-binding protein
MTTAAPLVTLAGVSKRFSTGTLALDGVDLAIGRGEFLSLLGPSGCGKSTLLRLVAGLMEPSGGRIAWDAAGGPCPRIGFVFQDATLMPWADALTNVRLPLRLGGKEPRAAQEARAAAALAAVGLQGFERAVPRELSGGMRMRVSLARALVTRPALLLMDEPFAALDELTRHRLNDDLLALWRATPGTTVVFVTHSVFESVYLSSRIVVMSARPGRIAATLEVEAPAPRPAGFRTSAGYAALCRRASEALERAMGADGIGGAAAAAVPA